MHPPKLAAQILRNWEIKYSKFSFWSLIYCKPLEQYTDIMQWVFLALQVTQYSDLWLLNLRHLLLPHNLFLTKSRTDISNSCSHGGLTLIQLLHPSAEDIHWKGREIPFADLCLFTASWHTPPAHCSLKCCAELNRPEGLVCAPASRESSSWLQNTQKCRSLALHSHPLHTRLVTSRTVKTDSPP